MNNYQLDDEQLLEYAKMASTIRQKISQKVSELNEEQKDSGAEDESELSHINL